MRMDLQIQDFKTGWFGITSGIQKTQIEILIRGLKNLKRDEDQHVHIR
jgi:hypothetical protein